MEDTALEPNGAVTVATYISCAAGLAVSSTLAQAWVALAYCGKIIADEWNRI